MTAPIAIHIALNCDLLEVDIGRRARGATKQEEFLPAIRIDGADVYVAAMPFDERRIALDWVVAGLASATTMTHARRCRLCGRTADRFRFALQTRDVITQAALDAAA